VVPLLLGSVGVGTPGMAGGFATPADAGAAVAVAVFGAVLGLGAAVVAERPVRRLGLGAAVAAAGWIANYAVPEWLAGGVVVVALVLWFGLEFAALEPKKLVGARRPEAVAAQGLAGAALALFGLGAILGSRGKSVAAVDTGVVASRAGWLGAVGSVASMPRLGWWQFGSLAAVAVVGLAAGAETLASGLVVFVHLPNAVGRARRVAGRAGVVAAAVGGAWAALRLASATAAPSSVLGAAAVAVAAHVDAALTEVRRGGGV
jgi:hypothetical protein